MRKTREERWKEQQQRFYVSGVWKDCSQAYKRAHPYCERCLREHVVTPADEVHHKIRLTPENITDLAVALCWDNLESLCEMHHKREHRTRGDARRWRIAPDGSVTVTDTPLGAGESVGAVNAAGT